MQSKTRTRLTVWWLAVLVCMVLPFPISSLVNLGGLVSVGWFVAIPLSIITFRRCERGQHLQRPGWYRAALAFQLGVAAMGLVAAAHTVLANGAIGLVTIATVQLVVAILTWRAITQPDPRRAVVAAMVSGFVTFVALMVDIALDLHFIGMRGHSIVTDVWSAFAIGGVLLSWVAGGLVCLAAIRTFGDATNLPDARAV